MSSLVPGTSSHHCGASVGICQNQHVLGTLVRRSIKLFLPIARNASAWLQGQCATPCTARRRYTYNCSRTETAKKRMGVYRSRWPLATVNNPAPAPFHRFRHGRTVAFNPDFNF